MYQRSLRSLLMGVLVLLPLSALAHTGVGHTSGIGAGFGHPLGGLDHLLAMLAVGLWAAQMGGRALWLVPSAFVGVMLVGGGLAVSGIQLPFVEQGIIASVLVLGLLIAVAFKLPPLTSALVVGSFALFHGFAHGAEMPLAAGAASYTFGFALGTALIHVTGAAGGLLLHRLKVANLVRLAGGAIALSGLYLAVA